MHAHGPMFFLIVNDPAWCFYSFQMWINPCAQVIFDSDPAPKDMTAPAGVEMMSQAMIRCVCVCVYESDCVCVCVCVYERDCVCDTVTCH